MLRNCPQLGCVKKITRLWILRHQKITFEWVTPSKAYSLQEIRYTPGIRKIRLNGLHLQKRTPSKKYDMQPSKVYSLQQIRHAPGIRKIHLNGLHLQSVLVETLKALKTWIFSKPSKYPKNELLIQTHSVPNRVVFFL